jgi:hypothetical protein
MVSKTITPVTMSYFPEVEKATSFPEELFFEVLKHLHPGAIWLFCRRVSRSWKLHVDCNIERYYKHYTLVLKNEREERKRDRQRERKQYKSDKYIESPYVVNMNPESDTLRVEVKWRMNHQFESLSYILLRARDIEVSRSGRDLSRDPWEETVVFAQDEKVSIFGSQMAISDIRSFMFPGLQPEKQPDPLGSPDYRKSPPPLQVGSRTMKIGDYEVGYSFKPILGGTHALTIETISIPFRLLMLFSTRHIISPTQSAQTQHSLTIFYPTADKQQSTGEKRRFVRCDLSMTSSK